MICHLLRDGLIGPPIRPNLSTSFESRDWHNHRYKIMRSTNLSRPLLSSSARSHARPRSPVKKRRATVILSAVFRAPSFKGNLNYRGICRLWLKAARVGSCVHAQYGWRSSRREFTRRTFRAATLYLGFNSFREICAQVPTDSLSLSFHCSLAQPYIYRETVLLFLIQKIG